MSHGFTELRWPEQKVCVVVAKAYVVVVSPPLPKGAIAHCPIDQLRLNSYTSLYNFSSQLQLVIFTKYASDPNTIFQPAITVFYSFAKQWSML